MAARELAVGVFCKAPEPGRVKTRLASAIGDKAAAAAHAELARNTIAMACSAHVGDVMVWRAGDARDAFFTTLAREFPVVFAEQCEGDLGARMAHAFDESLRDYRHVMLIGCDCPPLQATHLREAATALREGADAAFVPTQDGGYALVALARAQPALFRDIAWSTPTVMSATRARLSELGLRWRELETLWDVDEPQDWQRYLAWRDAAHRQ